MGPLSAVYDKVVKKHRRTGYPQRGVRQLRQRSAFLTRERRQIPARAREPVGWTPFVNSRTAALADDTRRVRTLIVESLRARGFPLHGVWSAAGLSKQQLRDLHRPAVEYRRAVAATTLGRKEDLLLSHIACGSEVNPERISPRLVEVHPGTVEELLVRYAAAHWSIPVSSGYGRRLRFVVKDEQNGKLMGVIGLGDPVFGLAARDQWVGWDREQRRRTLRFVMDAFLLGAVPPYSNLLCGKLVGLLVTSEDVQRLFARKYRNREALISGKLQSGTLAMMTTTSALGRSSVYNRLRYRGRLAWRSVGFTAGSGDFHFSDGIYEEIHRFANRWCEPTAKQTTWGTGFRNRRETIRAVLQEVGLPTRLQYHGVRREVFVAPLAENTREFLIGTDPHLRPYPQSAEALFDHFRHRWLLPRAARDRTWRDFGRESYRLWNHQLNGHWT